MRTIKKVNDVKTRIDKKSLLFMGIDLSIILLGVVILLSQTGSKTIFFLSVCLILAGLIFFVLALQVLTKPETERVVDERVTGINEKAGYHAFWITLVSVTILFWADRIQSLGIDVMEIYYATIFAGVCSWSILRWYYNRKGDVK